MIDKTGKAKCDPKKESHDLMAEIFGFFFHFNTMRVHALLSKPFLLSLFLKSLK